VAVGTLQLSVLTFQLHCSGGSGQIRQFAPKRRVKCKHFQTRRNREAKCFIDFPTVESTRWREESLDGGLVSLGIVDYKGGRAKRRK
jgi:hypothetical protein